MRLSLVVIAVAVALAPRASAQLKMPQESPAATQSLDVGVTTLTLSYHRPALRGRDFEKEVAAAGPIWRLGANEATTIAFTDPVTIGGTTLPAGTYAVFARVGKESWTIVLNKVAQQWGSYFHDEKQDVLRFDAKVERLPKERRREWFTLALDPVGADGAEVSIEWADVRVVVPIKVDVEALLSQRIAKALDTLGAKDWQTRLQIAQHWCRRKVHLDRALALIDEALKLEENNWTCEWKGRILHELDAVSSSDEEPAIPWIEKALEKSQGPSFPEGYREGLRDLIREWRDAGAR